MGLNAPPFVSRFAVSLGVRIHYLDYGGTGPTLLFVHGGWDHAHSWDFIAPAFTDSHRVFAVDLRGHGDSDWVPGSLYTVTEHVLDLIGVIASMSDAPLRLVGHSLGSTVCLRLAGLVPERVETLVAIEGFGPAKQHPSQVMPPAAYIRDWLQARVRRGAATHRTYADLGAAARRVREANSRLSPDLATYLAAQGTRRVADGRLTWKFDPAVRHWAPYGVGLQETVDVYSQVHCPVLILRGLESWTDEPDLNPRVRALQHREVLDVAKAGHWVHHDEPAYVIGAIREWFARSSPMTVGGRRLGDTDLVNQNAEDSLV